MLLAFVVASTFAPVQTSDAQELQYDINTDTGWYVRVTGSESLAVDNVMATSVGQLASVADTINVETNSPLGYRLLFSASSANLTNTVNANSYFSATTGSITAPIALAKNTWGFAFNKNNTGVVENGFVDSAKYHSASTPSVPDTSATWAAVPTTPTQLSSVENANVNTNGTDLNIYYGVNASTDLLGGTYSATITYTAYSEGVNEELPTMQDFTQTKCDALTTDVPTRLVDTRDLKVYSVTKMRDGNCWMTSNLALDGGRMLTPSDSDVTQNRTLPGNIVEGTTYEYNEPQIFSGSTDGVVDTSFANKVTSECDSSLLYCVANDVKYGNLYNWNAATAGLGKLSTDGAVYESVCPRGWRLPDDGTSSGIKSYANLIKAYIAGYDGSNVAAGATGGGYTQTIQQAPLNFALNGYYEDTYIEKQGVEIRYWSRVGYGAAAPALYVNALTGYFRPSSGNIKMYGFGVRCVFGE